MTAYKTAPLVSLHIVRDRTVRYPVDEVLHGGHAASLALAVIGDAPTESLLAIALGPRGAVLSVSVISSGGVAGTSASIADTFRPAIVAGASRLILAHNHPSGDPTPSPEDFAFTVRAIEAGKLLGVHVLDHVVVGSFGKSHSMSDAHEAGL